jgi:transcriptional regulator with XRE-family HTH domain
MVGVSKDAIGAWENMKRLPTPEYAELLATYLGLHVVEFWAKIYGYPLRAAEEGDRTWAEIGATISDEEFAELFQNVDDLTLHRRLVIISQILQDRCQSRQNGD